MNPAEFLLDLATGQVNDISVPEDINATQGSPEHEKIILRVTFLFSKLLLYNFDPFFFFIYLFIYHF